MREVLQSGAKHDVVYAECADGSKPAKEFYEGLAERDRDTFADLFIQLSEHGKIVNTERFRPKIARFECLVGGVKRVGAIAEFKIHHGSGQRMLAYREAREWILVGGFAKGRRLESEIEKARRAVCEDLRRRSPR